MKKLDGLHQLRWTNKHRLLFAVLLALITNVQAQYAEIPVALLPAEKEIELTPEKALSQQAILDEKTNAAINKDMVRQSSNNGEQGIKQWSGYAAAESMAVSGDPEGALNQLDARLVAEPKDAKAAYIKGMILMQLGRIDDAERWFKMMQSNFPDLPQSYNALAVIYAAKNDLYSAEAILRDLLEKHPEHQNARLNLANIYLNLAENELKNALKEAPNDAMINNTLQALHALRNNK